MPSRLSERIWAWLGRARRAERAPPPDPRGRIDHVVILDGTMSTLEPGYETNAGLTYKLLCEVAGSARLSLRYEAGIQWDAWLKTRDVIEGRGINRQIRRAYGAIASRYRPGDRIFLMGYSRGAYAVRSLAGVIDVMGLLRAGEATERNVRELYRHYQLAPYSAAAVAFRARHCLPEAPIEMVGVWDTVKALGIRLPLLWRFSEPRHAFHNHALGPSIRHGYHALAIDETRLAFEPVMWQTQPDWADRVEQVWFRGTHGDVGGHILGFTDARPLANIPLVWMMTKLEGCGIELPEGWRERFPMDRHAPSVGTRRGWGKLFVARRPRVIGRDPSERVHYTAADHPRFATEPPLPVTD